MPSPLTIALFVVFCGLLSWETYRRTSFMTRQHTFQQLLPHVQTLGFYLNLPSNTVRDLAREWTELRGIPTERKILLIRAGIHPAAAASPHTRLLDDDTLEHLNVIRIDAR